MKNFQPTNTDPAVNPSHYLAGAGLVLLGGVRAAGWVVRERDLYFGCQELDLKPTQSFAVVNSLVDAGLLERRAGGMVRLTAKGWQCVEAFRGEGL